MSGVWDRCLGGRPASPAPACTRQSGQPTRESGRGSPRREGLSGARMCATARPTPARPRQPRGRAISAENGVAQDSETKRFTAIRFVHDFRAPAPGAGPESSYLRVPHRLPRPGPRRSPHGVGRRDRGRRRGWNRGRSHRRRRRVKWDDHYVGTRPVLLRRRGPPSQPRPFGQSMDTLPRPLPLLLRPLLLRLDNL